MIMIKSQEVFVLGASTFLLLLQWVNMTFCRNWTIVKRGINPTQPPKLDMLILFLFFVLNLSKIIYTQK